MRNRFKKLELADSSNNNDSIKLSCPACKSTYNLGDKYCKNCGGDFKKSNKKNTPTATKNSAVKQSFVPKSSSSAKNKVQKKRLNLSSLVKKINYSHLYLIFIAILILIAILRPGWFSLDLFIKF